MPNGGESPSVAPPFARVVLLDVEGLSEPAVASPFVYQPSTFLSIGTSSGGNTRVTSFVLTVASRKGESLKMRVLMGSGAGSSTDLVGFQGESGDHDPWDPTAFVAAHPEVRDLLEQGSGVFTTILTGSEGNLSEHVLGVILPETLLGSSVRLSVFTNEVNGVTVGDARIELVLGFYYVGVVGDSIAWGNGLRTSDKTYTLVQETIERELGVRTVLQNLSQTEATLATNSTDQPCLHGCWGEVPRSRTSIATQVTLLKRPELLDLVLLTGCLNDVSLRRILDPFIDPDRLTELTVEACDTSMTQLLQDLRRLAPQATLVVMGLYPIVSEQSDLLGVEQMRLVYGSEPVPFLDGLVSALAQNSALFATTANDALKRAADKINTMSSSEAPVLFADPGFGSDNAIFAPHTRLWGLTPDNRTLPLLNFGVEWLPEDPIAATRWEACLERVSAIHPVSCLYGSVAHPRPEGAQAYADSVITQLRNAGVLPASH